MEAFEKTVLDRLNKLVENGWYPEISFEDRDKWSCNMTHKSIDFRKLIIETMKQINDHTFFKYGEDISLLRLSINKHKTMLDAIIAACDLVELIKIEDEITR